VRRGRGAREETARRRALDVKGLGLPIASRSASFTASSAPADEPARS
jgi:hypothetical protein